MLSVDAICSCAFVRLIMTLATEQADKECRIDVANPKSMRAPSPSNGSKGSKGIVAPFNRDRGTGNGSAQFVQLSLTPSSAPLSRLVMLEAQLRALDAL